MRVLPILVLLLVSNTAAAQEKTDTLTNETVVKLSRIGLQPSVIINKIQSSYGQFDVSTAGLIKLSESGVAADVINEMLKANTTARNVAASAKDPNDPASMRKAGIYAFDPLDTVRHFVRLDPTVTSTTKSGGFLTAMAQAYSHGIAQDQLVSSLAGKSSRTQISDPKPVFYFYFDANQYPGADNWFFGSGTSPNEFVLVRLNSRKNSREMVVGQANAYGSSSGIADQAKIPFDYEEIANGIYKVTLKRALKDGEYGFLYASSAPTRYQNNKVFDFGIQTNSDQ